MNSESTPTHDKEPNHPDRRGVPRVDLEIEVTATSEANFFLGFTEDISEGGLFIATHHKIAAGELMTVEFSLPGIKDALRVKCEVRWLRAQNAQSDVPPGAGVRFIDLEPDVRALIDRFMAKRPAMFHEE